MPASPPRLRPLAIACLIAFALAGCASAPSLPGVYRLDVQQGNVVEQDMLDQLEPGMDKRKVQFILGTPMLVDTFNPDRWEYLYTFSERGGRREKRRVSLYFRDERLERIEGDVARAATRRAPAPRPDRVVVVPEDYPSRGFFDALRPGFLDERQRRRREVLSDSEPQSDGEPPAEGTPTATASAAPAAQPAAPGPEEETFFRNLFDRMRGDEAASPAAGAPAALPAAPVAAETPAPAAPAESAEAEDDGGFFKGLVERFRRAREGEPAGDAPPPAPPSLPPGARSR